MSPQKNPMVTKKACRKPIHTNYKSNNDDNFKFLYTYALPDAILGKI